MPTTCHSETTASFRRLSGEGTPADSPDAHLRINPMRELQQNLLYLALPNFRIEQAQWHDPTKRSVRAKKPCPAALDSA